MESSLHWYRKYLQSKSILGCKLNYSYFVVTIVFTTRNRIYSFICVWLTISKVHEDEIEKKNNCECSEQAASSIEIRKTRVHFNVVYSKKVCMSNVYETEMRKSIQS
jgi:hypothetical protein